MQISSLNQSTELQVHTSASYSLILLGCLVCISKSTFPRQNTVASLQQACCTGCLTHSRSGQKSWILLFPSHPYLFLQETLLLLSSKCSQDLMPPHTPPGSHPLLRHNHFNSLLRLCFPLLPPALYYQADIPVDSLKT